MAQMPIMGSSELEYALSISPGRFLRFKTPFLGDAETIFSLYCLNDWCELRSILNIHPKN